MNFSSVFPGQGSQSPGMGQFLYNEFKIAQHTFEEASDTLSFDLKKLCFSGSEEDLALTENTQPALLTTSVATARVLEKEFGVCFTATAGHSIGEYSSFVMAQSLNFTDAVKAVRARGQFMQKAVPIGQGGMMATLGLNAVQAEFLCQWGVQNSKSGPLSPANYNCEGQIVISGSQTALLWLKENFKAEIFEQNGFEKPSRAKLIPLQVSAPFHCAMMKPAEDQMREFLNQFQFQNAAYPIYQNKTALPETQNSILKENLILQISGSVLWSQSINKMIHEGHRSFIECGHGSVLKGLIKKINTEVQVFTTQSLEDLKLIEAAQNT